MADELYSRIPDTPISDDTARLERIRGALEKLNYSYDGVRELLGERAFEAMARDQVVPGTWRVQNILDELCPGLLGLGLTLLSMRLLKNRVSPIILIFILFAVGIVGYGLGLLA